jgi:hypothetical protein
MPTRVALLKNETQKWKRRGKKSKCREGLPEEVVGGSTEGSSIWAVDETLDGTSGAGWEFLGRKW